MDYYKKLKNTIEEQKGKFDDTYKDAIEEQKGKIKGAYKEQKEKFDNNYKDTMEEQKQKINITYKKQKEKIKDTVGESKEKRQEKERVKQEEKLRLEKEKIRIENAKGNNKIVIIGGGIVLFLFISIFGAMGLMGLLDEDDKDNKDNVNTVAEVYNEIEEVEAVEKVEVKENDAAKLIYNDAIGKVPYDIFEDLEKQGFEVNFLHAVSKVDFTSSIKEISDPENEFYIPWVITNLDTFDANKKYASFYINTQERTDAENKDQEIEEKLTAKLSPSVAWGTTDVYGNKEYPYGFKLKIASGMLSETAVDENTWFLKAQCDVKNQYGTWMENLVCEARVTGTTDSPQIIYFNVYNP